MLQLLRKIREMLGKVSVSGYENIKRMGAVMDALDELIAIADEAEKEQGGAEKEGDHDDHHDEQGK